MKRLTAEEVAENLTMHANYSAVSDAGAVLARDTIPASSQLAFASNLVRYNLIPQWQDQPDEDTHARCPWWWCEDCGPESPPQLLRCYRPMMVTALGDLTVDMQAPKEWTRWTVAGWVPLVGRVCSIGERPS